jgi:hypothetical protein
MNFKFCTMLRKMVITFFGRLRVTNRRAGRTRALPANDNPPFQVFLVRGRSLKPTKNYFAEGRTSISMVPTFS